MKAIGILFPFLLVGCMSSAQTGLKNQPIAQEPTIPAESMPQEKPKSLINALPATVHCLFQWPDAAVLQSDKRIDPSDPRVASPRNQSWEWINKVCDASWLPPAGAEMIFVGKEFNDRDVARIQWDCNGYHIEISQTASIFAVKLVSLERHNAGADRDSRFEYARQLCMKVFKDEGRMWTQDAQGAGKAVAIPALKNKILSFCFNLADTEVLAGDGVVIGTPKSIKEARIDASSEDLTGTPEAWSYWFRNIHWWNDGGAVGAYFLKLDGPGAWMPSFVGEIDVNWFRLARDRMGRPISN